jgi:hypothetical protein
VLIAYKYSDYLFGDTVPYIKWWPAMVNVPIPTGGDTVSYQTNILQLGSVEANRITLDGTSGNLTAGRIASRGDGSGGTIRCAPAGNTGESSIAFYRNGNGTVSSAAGDQWVIGQGSYGAGDRGFGIGCNNTGLCLRISGEEGRTRTIVLQSPHIEVIPVSDGGDAVLRFFRNTNRTYPVAGDLWLLSGTTTGDRNFSIRYNDATTSWDAMKFDPTGIVRIPGSLQVGGYEAGMKPWVSCYISSAGVIGYNCGQKPVNTVTKLGEGSYEVDWGTAHPLDVNYVPIMNLSSNVGFIYHSNQYNNKLVVITTNTGGGFADRAFYLLIT